MSRSIYKLVYVSSASKPMSQGEILELLEISRQNNFLLDVTGILLCYEGNFFQLLEGEKETVKDLYAKISEDGRHRGVIRIFSEVAEEREFPNWSMGYKLVDGSWDHEFREGLNDIFKNGGLDLEDTVVRGASIKVHKLLNSFRKISGIAVP